MSDIVPLKFEEKKTDAMSKMNESLALPESDLDFVISLPKVTVMREVG